MSKPPARFEVGEWVRVAKCSLPERNGNYGRVDNIWQGDPCPVSVDGLQYAEEELVPAPPPVGEREGHWKRTHATGWYWQACDCTYPDFNPSLWCACSPEPGKVSAKVDGKWKVDRETIIPTPPASGEACKHEKRHLANGACIACGHVTTWEDIMRDEKSFARSTRGEEWRCPECRFAFPRGKTLHMCSSLGTQVAALEETEQGKKLAREGEDVKAETKFDDLAPVSCGWCDDTMRTRGRLCPSHR